MIDWLELQTDYSPDAYVQMASVLSTFGYFESARRVRIASKNRELATSSDNLRKFNLGTQWLFIEYGYGYWRVAMWMLIFCAIGVRVLRKANHPPGASVVARWFYSFDRLIPVVKLSESHFKPELTGGAKYYFFIHTLAGFILASYLVAGLTGIAG